MMLTLEYRILTLISKIMDSVRFSDLGGSDIRFISISEIGVSNLGPPMAIPMTWSSTATLGGAGKFNATHL